MTPSQAQAELRSLHREMLTLFPWRMPDNWAAEVTVAPLLKSIVGDVRPRLLLLSGAVGLVLLIACANVANLMLARAAARQREISLRSALGADTGRLIRQMLTESAVLAAISGFAGRAARGHEPERAQAGASARHAASCQPRPAWRRVPVRSWRVASDRHSFRAGSRACRPAGATCRVACASNSGNVFGNARRFRVSQLLVVGQIALAVVVITAAGVMLRSLYRLANTDPGFHAEQTLTAQISLDRSACAQKGSCLAFFDTLLTRAEGLPGVESAALVDALPMTGYDTWYVFDAEDHPRDPRQLALAGIEPDRLSQLFSS